MAVARPPARLNDFIGQPRVVAHVHDLVTGARRREEPVESLLLLGPPGHGKTALAEAIARQYDGSRSADSSNIKTISAGPHMTSAIVENLSALKHCDFFFIDEIHSLDREAQEVLNLAIDELRTFKCTAKGKVDRGQPPGSISKFTLIGATTEPGKLTHALRSRLHSITLEAYEQRALKAITEKAADELALNMTHQAARHLAEHSQRTPRDVKRLVKLLAVTKSGLSKIDQQTVRVFLDELGIDERGLNPSQQEYLRILATASGRRTNLAILRARLGLDAKYIQEDVESLLTLLRLVEIGSGGRTLTEEGRAVADEMARERLAKETREATDYEPAEEAT